MDSECDLNEPLRSIMSELKGYHQLDCQNDTITGDITRLAFN